jgi:sugar phosphate isomerase/epimerase
LICSRRQLVRTGAAAAILSPLAGFLSQQSASAAVGDDPWRGLKLGVASYTFHKLPLEATVEGMRRVGVKYASIKDVHMPLRTTAEQRKAVVKRFNDAGITPLSCGVITMTNDETSVRTAFEYARDAGIPTIVCNPARQALPLLDKLVKEFDIRLAIHNHGPEDKVWPSPYDVWDAVQSFDQRIGLCIDVGHTARCGVDPSEAIVRCSARLYDLHLKDLNGVGPKSQPIEVGRGTLDIRKILAALIQTNYRFHVGLEHEKDMNDPLPGVAESIGYIRGVLASK